MKPRDFLLIVILLTLATFAFGQSYHPPTDVLGAHLNYDRGCAACHAPHSGARGNGISTTDTTTGNYALWGQDIAQLEGKTIITGEDDRGGTYVEVLPASFSAGTPDVGGILTCLSCHDGNWAKGAMMQNKIYETVPSTYASNNIPTLLGNDNDGMGDYLNDHPVGLNAVIQCGGSYNWDCVVVNGAITYPSGTKMYQFVQNYGFFVTPAAYNGNPIVLCTTCHNQHLMNVVKVTTGAKSGLPTGYYQTMFFIRGPYNPGSTTAGSNQTAQFCRQCHGGEANEMNNDTAITVF